MSRPVRFMGLLGLLVSLPLYAGEPGVTTFVKVTAKTQFKAAKAEGTPTADIGWGDPDKPTHSSVVLTLDKDDTSAAWKAAQEHGEALKEVTVEYYKSGEPHPYYRLVFSDAKVTKLELSDAKKNTVTLSFKKKKAVFLDPDGKATDVRLKP